MIPFFLGRGKEALEGGQYQAVCPACAGFDRLARAARTYLFEGDSAKKVDNFHELQRHVRDEFEKLNTYQEIAMPEGWSPSEFHAASLNLKEVSAGHEGRHIAFWEYQRAYAWLQWKEALLARSGKEVGYVALRFLHTVRNSFLLRALPLEKWVPTMECLLIRDVAPNAAVTNSPTDVWGEKRRPRYCAADDGSVDSEYGRGRLYGHELVASRHWRYLLFPDVTWRGHGFSSMLRYRPADDSDNIYRGVLEFWDVNTGGQWNMKTVDFAKGGEQAVKEFDYRSVKTADKDDFREKLQKIQQFFKMGKPLGRSSSSDDWVEFEWLSAKNYGDAFKQAFAGWEDGQEMYKRTGKGRVDRKVRTQKIGNCGYKNTMKGVNLIITLLFEGMDATRYGSALSQHLKGDKSFLRATSKLEDDDDAEMGQKKKGSADHHRIGNSSHNKKQVKNKRLEDKAEHFDNKWRDELSSPQRVAKAFGIDSKRDSLVYLRQEWSQWDVCTSQWKEDCKPSGEVAGYKSMQHLPIVEDLPSGGERTASLRCQWWARGFETSAQDGGQEELPRGLEEIPLIGEYLRGSERDGEFQKLWGGVASKYDDLANRNSKYDYTGFHTNPDRSNPPPFVQADCAFRANLTYNWFLKTLTHHSAYTLGTKKKDQINSVLKEFKRHHLPTILSEQYNDDPRVHMEYEGGLTPEDVLERFKQGWKDAFEAEPYSAITFMRILQALKLARPTEFGGFGCDWLARNPAMREFTAHCQRAILY